LSLAFLYVRHVNYISNVFCTCAWYFSLSGILCFQNSDIFFCTQLKNTVVLSHENNQSSSQQFPNWPTVGQNDNASNTEELDAKSVEQQHHQEQQSSAMETKQHVPNADNQQQKGDVPQEPTHPPVLQKKFQDDIKQELVEQAPVQTPQSIGGQSSEQNPTPKSEPDKMQISDVDSQFLNFQKIGNQQTAGTDQAGNQKNSKQIPFVLLLPALKPHLDKDREMQLQTLFNKLRVGI
jgi:transcription initiation factor TFIID subunit 4